MRRSVCALALAACVVSAGCKKDKVEVYQVSREQPQAAMPNQTPPLLSPTPAAPPAMQGTMPAPDPGAMPAGMIPESPQGSPSEVQWKLPAGWTEQPASGMRLGSFSYLGKNGQKADISVIPLAGDVGGELANINRWREQLNLGPISEKELPTYRKQLDFGGHSMGYVDLVSQQPLIEAKFKKRIVAATYVMTGRTWFFKMVGDNDTIEAAIPGFKQFLKSLKFKA